jgi:hypothetical protein
MWPGVNTLHSANISASVTSTSLCVGLLIRPVFAPTGICQQSESDPVLLDYHSHSSSSQTVEAKTSPSSNSSSHRSAMAWKASSQR